MDLDKEFIKVLGGLKSEPTEIKINAVEIGIDDILDPSGEEIDTKDELIRHLLENKETISKDIENLSPNNSEEESTAKVLGSVLDETQTKADFNASKNLQSDEIFVLNFGKMPVKPKEVDWSEVYNSNITTDVTKELKEVIVTPPPKGSTIVGPHEYTRLAKGKFGCNHCQHTTNDIRRLRKHIRQMHRTVTEMNQCPYCPFKSKWSLRYHMIFKHKEDNEIQWFKCHLCSLKFKLKCGLSDHMKSHLNAEEMLDDMHNCNICKKAFKRRDGLVRHIKGVHNKDKLKKIQCQECDYVTTNQASLTHHFQNCHTDLKAQPVYQCEECQYKTRNKRAFYIHKSTHKAGLICESCGYKANVMDKMNLHLLTHKKELSETDLKYKCDRCDYKAYRLYSLQVHKLKHLKPEEIEYFYCYHCDFKAKRKDNLKTHVLRHFKKEEVKLQCYQCKFSSKKRTLLTNHMKKEHPKETP